MLRCSFLSLLVMLVGSAFASAQPAAEAKAQPDKVGKNYEDIEIMRSLLLDKVQTSINQCSKCHVNPFAPSARPGSTGFGPGEVFGGDPHHGQSARANVGGEGAYVKGHGVIFQLHVPPVISILSPGNSAKHEKPLTDWERM